MQAVDNSFSEDRRIAARPGLPTGERDDEAAFEELAHLAAQIAGAEYAYIGFFNNHGFSFKACVGFDAQKQAHATAACEQLAHSRGTLLVADLTLDARFATQSIALYNTAACRSYAGVPLLNAHHQQIGVLAVLSIKPHSFTERHLAQLAVLGRQIVARLDLEQRTRALEQEHRAHQRLEHALSVERCFVASTLDSIPALVAVLDTAGRMVRMNYPCAQLTGMSTTSTSGHKFVQQFLAAEDHEWVEELIRAAAAGQSSGPQETAWRVLPAAARTAETKAAAITSRRVSWTLRPLKGAAGDIQYLIVSGQDVTEQRRIEQALLSSETRYQQMVENSLGFVFTCSTEGRLTSLNASTAETLGYRAEDLQGRALRDLVEPASLPLLRECMAALDAGEEWKGALPLRRGDGAYRRIAIRGRRRELPADPPFLLFHGIDVTEQFHAEQALLTATRQRELILEAAGDGIFGIDLHGRITFANSAAAHLLGYASEQLTGLDMHATLLPRHPSGRINTAESDPILAALRARVPLPSTSDFFWRKNGTTIPVEFSANPLLENGHVHGMVVSFQDVSERRRLEHMKDEFISSVSHELRTPLTSLRAALGLIATGALEKRPEKRAQMLEMAIANCDRLTRLINNIVDFDALQRPHEPLHQIPVESSHLLRRAADIAHRAASLARIPIRISPSSAMVLAEEARILKALNELLSNAIKFSPPESEIKLSARPASLVHNDLPSTVAPSDVLFLVEDEGRGIPHDKLEHIFDRFQQIDASDSRDLGGTGLGLALCRAIVEQHGGILWVESTPDKGSRFYFTLPAAPNSASQI